MTVDQQAVAKIPANYKFVEPGTLTVAISALNSPPLALLASDNRTRIGSDPDIARLLAGSLGLKLKLVPTAWEDWPLGITSGRYDVALVNIAVTEQRKEKFDLQPIASIPRLLGEIHQQRTVDHQCERSGR